MTTFKGEEADGKFWIYKVTHPLGGEPVGVWAVSVPVDGVYEFEDSVDVATFADACALVAFALDHGRENYLNAVSMIRLSRAINGIAA